MLSYSAPFVLAVIGCAPHTLRPSELADAEPPQSSKADKADTPSSALTYARAHAHVAANFANFGPRARHWIGGGTIPLRMKIRKSVVTGVAPWISVFTGAVPCITPPSEQVAAN